MVTITPTPTVYDDLHDVVRRKLLEHHGRIYGELHLAIARTDGLSAEGDEFKRARFWQDTKPLATADFGASFVSNFCADRNPVLVLRPSNLIGLDADGEGGLQRLQATAKLPPTVVVVTGAGHHF
jgi:hypothetical protein